MGYAMELTAAAFRIRKEHTSAALQAIQNMDPTTGTGGHWSGGQCVARWFAFLNDVDLHHAGSLADAFDMWRWDAYEDNGDVVVCHFFGERLGDDELLWKAVAPFVVNGSYIEMRGEDGALWRWVFENGEMRTAHARIVWE